MKKILIIVISFILINNSYSNNELNQAYIVTGMGAIFFSDITSNDINFTNNIITGNEVLLISGVSLIVLGDDLAYNNKNTYIKKKWQHPTTVTLCITGALIMIKSISYPPTEELYQKYKNNPRLDGKYAFDGIFNKNEKGLLTGLGVFTAGVIINKITFKHEFKNKGYTCLHPTGFIFNYKF